MAPLTTDHGAPLQGCRGAGILRRLSALVCSSAAPPEPALLVAARGPRSFRTGIQLALALAIVLGAWMLYRVIADPGAAHEQRQRLTLLTRARMDHVRTALAAYHDRADAYPATLDALVVFVKSDSAGRALDSAFALSGGASRPDSLPFSPRTGSRFVYEIARDDAAGAEVYYLQDPDNEADFIGARAPDPTRRDDASWE